MTHDAISATGIEHGHADYTAGELLEQCQANAASLLLATASVLAERGLDVGEWAAAVATVLLRSWQPGASWPPAAMLDALLTNYRALGATVTSIDLTEEAPTATIEGYPDDELAASLGVDPALSEVMLHVGAHIARQLGCDFTWQRDGASIALRVSRDSASE